jgi:cytochrome c peroxidase
MKRILIIFPSLFLLSCTTENDFSLKQPTTKAELGELLFFDPILSRDSSVSCASCHKPEFGFADNTTFSKGVKGKIGNRNTPPAMNLSSRNFLFWDGRSESLEDQCRGPIENPVEMDLPVSEVINRLYRHKYYVTFFMKLYGKQPNAANITNAIAEYERTLETNNTAFDDYMTGKDTSGFSASAKRGQEIFNVKGKCFDCHFGPDFTGDQFRNIGLFNGKDLNDSGRFMVTRRAADIGRFKTPGLRNISVTAPYMHNGMFKTLREVIDYYDTPDKFVANSVNRDTLLKEPLKLSEAEKKDLENFLLTLTDRRFLSKK